MCNTLPDEVYICGINEYQLSIMRKNMDNSNEYLNRKENQYHTDMKIPTLMGTNFEEFGLVFKATVRRQNSLIGIPLGLEIIIRTGISVSKI